MREIVRMNALGLDRENAQPALAGTDEANARQVRQDIDAIAGQRLLMREDRVEAQAVDIIERIARPIAPEISGVPASNRAGGSWNASFRR